MDATDEAIKLLIEQEIEHQNSGYPYGEEVIQSLVGIADCPGLIDISENVATSELSPAVDAGLIKDLDDLIDVILHDEAEPAMEVKQELTDEDIIKINEIETHLRCITPDKIGPSCSSTDVPSVTTTNSNKICHDLPKIVEKTCRYPLLRIKKAKSSKSCYKYENGSATGKMKFLVTHDTKWEYGEIILKCGTRIGNHELESINEILSKDGIQEYRKIMKFLDYDTLILIESMKEKTIHECTRIIRCYVFNKIMKKGEEISYKAVAPLAAIELRKNWRQYRKSAKRICYPYFDKNYSACLKRRLSDIGILSSRSEDEVCNDTLFNSIFTSIADYTYIEAARDIMSKGSNYNRSQQYITDFLENIKKNTTLWEELNGIKSTDQSIHAEPITYHQLLPQNVKVIADKIAEDVISKIKGTRAIIVRNKPAAIINAINMYRNDRIMKKEVIAIIGKTIELEYSDATINRMVVEIYNLSYSLEVLKSIDMKTLPSVCISIFDYVKKIVSSHLEKEPLVIFNLLEFSFISVNAEVLYGPDGNLLSDIKEISEKITAFYTKWILGKYKLPPSILPDNLSYSETNPRKINQSMRIIADGFSDKLVSEISKEISNIISIVDRNFNEIIEKINNLGDCMLYLKVSSVKHLSAVILGQCMFNALKKLYSCRIHIVDILKNGKMISVVIKKKLDKIELSRCILYIIKSVNSVILNRNKTYESIALSKIRNYANINLETSVLCKVEELMFILNIEAKNKSIYTVIRHIKNNSYQDSRMNFKTHQIIVGKLTNLVKKQVCPSEEFVKLLDALLNDKYFFYGQEKRSLSFNENEEAKKHLLTIFDKCWTKNIRFFVRMYIISEEKLKTGIRSLLVPAAKFTFSQENVTPVENESNITTDKSLENDECNTYILKNYGKMWICISSKLSKALNQFEISAANNIHKYFEEKKLNFLSNKAIQFTTCSKLKLKQINIVSEVSRMVNLWLDETPEKHYNAYEVDRILLNLDENMGESSFVLHSEVMSCFLKDSKSFFCSELTKKGLRTENIVAHINERAIVRETYLLFSTRFNEFTYERFKDPKKLIEEELRKIESLPLLEAIRSIVNLEKANINNRSYNVSSLLNKEYSDSEKWGLGFDAKVETLVKKMKITSPNFHKLLGGLIESILSFINTSFKHDMAQIRKYGIEDYLLHRGISSIKNLCEATLKDVFIYKISTGEMYKKIYSLLDICVSTGWTASKDSRIDTSLQVLDIIAEKIVYEFNNKVLPEELALDIDDLSGKKVSRKTMAHMNDILYLWEKVVRNSMRENKSTVKRVGILGPSLSKLNLKNQILESTQVSTARNSIVATLNEFQYLSKPDYEPSNFDEIDKIGIMDLLEKRLEKIIETETNFTTKAP
ncbi:hypothetical protein [Candidatus Ichthyocystis hellenicum]|uniref:hypothetical protein n=1 Tax=Candidatus Ichthyocystis hellenicum TaxID=1561003 RepID=UPI000B8698FC|nr:hypothetical protein [Candidatus Ichthyocystis hellenicum]